MLTLFAGAFAGNVIHHHYLKRLLGRFPRNILLTYAEC
jgi:hypothetical protein